MSDTLEKKQVSIQFAEQEWVLSGCGSLFWPEQKVLVVADLHLEKGSYFANRGNPLPLYDSINTLRKIEEAIHYFKPLSVISLGDNLHDNKALDRMPKQICDRLITVINQVEQWIWLKGNHDSDYLPDLANHLSFNDYFDKNHITFAHELMPEKSWQVVGHFHPKIQVNSVKGRCFVKTDRILYMPAFGTFAGGLDVNSKAFQQILNTNHYAVFISYKNKIWQVK